MAKPVKGNKNKRPASDDRRLAKAHLNQLKNNKAIMPISFEVPEGFTRTVINSNKVRVKGVGAQALKMASLTNSSFKDVVSAIKERNWSRVVTLIPRYPSPEIDYKLEP